MAAAERESMSTEDLQRAVNFCSVQVQMSQVLTEANTILLIPVYLPHLD